MDFKVIAVKRPNKRPGQDATDRHKLKKNFIISMCELIENRDTRWPITGHQPEAPHGRMALG